MLDLDQQHSSLLWNRLREKDGRQPLPCTIADSARELQDIVLEYAGVKGKILVVDCGGFDSDVNRVAIRHADIILTPIRPSQIEIFGLQKFLRILEEEGKQAKVVISGALPQSIGRVEGLKEYISGKDRFQLMKAVVRYRMDFQTAYAAGLSVIELNQESPAAREVTGLAREVKGLIDSL
jgi:chromosome partitioning protein